jgi:hypothetical protein
MLSAEIMHVECATNLFELLEHEAASNVHQTHLQKLKYQESN